MEEKIILRMETSTGDTECVEFDVGDTSIDLYLNMVIKMKDVIRITEILKQGSHYKLVKRHL